MSSNNQMSECIKEIANMLIEEHERLKRIENKLREMDSFSESKSAADAAVLLNSKASAIAHLLSNLHYALAPKDAPPFRTDIGQEAMQSMFTTLKEIKKPEEILQNFKKQIENSPALKVKSEAGDFKQFITDIIKKIRDALSLPAQINKDIKSALASVKTTTEAVIDSSDNLLKPQ